MTPRSWPTRATVVLLLAACPLLVEGCASGRQGGPETARPSAGSERFSRLAALARSQDRESTDARPIQQPPFALTVEPPENEALAVEPLDDVIAALAASVRVETPARDEDRANRALLAYASARSAQIGGDVETAIRLLERAADLDPASPQIQRALGDAYAEQGRGASAAEAYSRAVDLGLSEPVPVFLVAREAISSRDVERAAVLLSMLLDDGLGNQDPALPVLVRAGLGRALLATGRLRAGAEAIELALAPAPSLTGPTRLSRAWASGLGQRPELLLAAGDAWLRLGEPQRAARVYDTLSELEDRRVAELRARRAFIARATGRPAASALLILERLAETGGVPSDDDRAFLIELSSGQRERRAIDEALAELAAITSSPTAISAIARTRAEIDPDNSAALVDLLAAESLRSPSRGTLTARELLGPIGSSESARLVERAHELIDIAPSAIGPVGAALVTHTSDPGALLAEIAERSNTPERTALHAAALAELARYTDAIGAAGVIDPAQTEDGSRAGIEAVVALAAIAAGDWAFLEQWLPVTAGAPIPSNQDLLRVRARLWATLNNTDRALAHALAIPEAERSVPDLVRIAALRELEGDAETARELLRRAAELDPFDARVAEARLVLLQRIGEPASGEVADIARQLREQIPASDTVRRLFDADQRFAAGQLDDAENQLRTLFSERPADGNVGARLERVWQVRVARAQSGPLDEAERWVEAVAARRPGLSEPTRLLSSLRAARGDVSAAIETVELYREETGSADLDRRLEGLYRASPGRRDDYLALRNSRLSALKLPLNDALEALAELQTSLRDEPLAVTNVVTAAERLVPPYVRFAPSQYRNAGLLVQNLRVETFGGGNEADEPQPYARMVGWAVERGAPLSGQLHLDRVLILADNPGEVEPLAVAIRQAESVLPEIGPALLYQSALVLFDSARGDRAFDLAYRFAFPTPDSFSDIHLRIALEFAGRLGEVGRGRALIERLEAAGLVEQAVEASGVNLDQNGRTRGAAELAYRMASVAYNDRPDDAARFFELALEYDPGHPWTCNDYGYLLLERGNEGDLDRAAELIPIAYEKLPGEDSVTDTAGWLRYRQGVLEDRLDDEGALVEEGAISLLRRAIQLARDQRALDEERLLNDYATLADHLGDALYAAGRFAEARDAWEQAQRQLEQRARAVADQGLALDAATRDELAQEARDEIRKVVNKIRDLALGRRPQIAPTAALAEDERPQPPAGT